LARACLGVTSFRARTHESIECKKQGEEALIHHWLASRHAAQQCNFDRLLLLLVRKRTMIE
jgi:hypothetical protein